MKKERLGICNLTQRLTCVASVSVWFRSKERPRNGAFDFGRARNGTRAKLSTKGEAKGKDNLSSPPLPALLLSTFYTRSLTPVPRSLLQNRTETLATQATQRQILFSFRGPEGILGV